MIRIGHGFDVHAFADNGPLILGGVSIPYHYGLAAYSDGDVLLHAVIDALLGAMALGDIGQHFPDNDSCYAGVSSRYLLRLVFGMLTSRGYCLNNLDATIKAQAPYMKPYINCMRKYLSADLQSTLCRINIKATTTEKLGFIGREEGIACEAVVSIIRIS